MTMVIHFNVSETDYTAATVKNVEYIIVISSTDKRNHSEYYQHSEAQVVNGMALASMKLLIVDINFNF